MFISSHELKQIRIRLKQLECEHRDVTFEDNSDLTYGIYVYGIKICSNCSKLLVVYNRNSSDVLAFKKDFAKSLRDRADKIYKTKDREEKK